MGRFELWIYYNQCLWKLLIKDKIYYMFCTGIVKKAVPVFFLHNNSLSVNNNSIEMKIKKRA